MASPEEKEILVPAPMATETVTSEGSPGALSRSSNLLLCLLLMFACSGCAALIYEIIWFQMLQLVIGSTAVSLAVLLATFMGGLCLGSILLPRYIGPRINPLCALALFELSIGLLGIVFLFALPWLARQYAAIAPSGPSGIFLRGLLCSLCLLLPTVLMGGTLPTVARISEATPNGASQLGLIYAANTLGAVCGALLTGFYVLRVADVFTATFIAAAINAGVACIALSLRVPDSTPRPSSAGQHQNHAKPYLSIYLAIALSGLCALSAEVIWTRLLSLMLGGTTYTFSIILAVFLLGLGIGSGFGAFLARRIRRPAFALGICQLLLAVAMAWTAFMLAKSLPFWPINPTLATSVWFVFQLDFLRCLWAILPAACLWGASFPLALAATTAPPHEPSRLVGRLYASNTVGAIIGAVGTIFLIAWAGTRDAQRLLIALCVLAGFIALARPSLANTARWHFRHLAVWTVLCALAALLVWSVPALPWSLVAYGRYLTTRTDYAELLYMGEGMNASVAVTEEENGVRNFHISGKTEASSDAQDMRLQLMLGHIPALLHPQPRSVLVVGCGAGVTAGSFLKHPSIERITICEIEPLIPKAVTRYFGEENNDVLLDGRVRLVNDDARHFVLTTHERFDVLTSDPIHPWVKGAATLYTREYFELCKQRLNPGGIITQWVPLYETSLEAVKSEIATFFEVFPEGSIWSNDHLGSGYDLVLLGQVEPLEINVNTLQGRLNREDYRKVGQSLREVGLRSAFSLMATYAGQSRDLKPWLKSASINRDRDLRLQYLAGLGLNLNNSDSIYADILTYRRFPEEIFGGSNIWNEALRAAFMPHQDTSKAQGRDSQAGGHASATNHPASGNPASPP